MVFGTLYGLPRTSEIVNYMSYASHKLNTLISTWNNKERFSNKGGTVGNASMKRYQNLICWWGTSIFFFYGGFHETPPGSIQWLISITYEFGFLKDSSLLLGCYNTKEWSLAGWPLFFDFHFSLFSLTSP